MSVGDFIKQAIRSSRRVYGDGFVWIDEVRSRTGYQVPHAKDEARRERQRYADLVAVSLYPSRGCWMAGFEVKAHREDWLRELRDPSKSDAVKRYCRHWWLAARPNVARDEEVPEGWGLVIVRDPPAVGVPLVQVYKKAPVLEAEPPTMTLLASIVRNLDRKVSAR